MIQIINDDCLNALKDMPDNSVDYVLTSPPYNVGRKRHYKSEPSKYEHFEDANPNYLQWSIDIIDELLRITNNHIFWNIQSRWTNKVDVYKLIGHYSDKILQNFIWTKESFTPASERYAISNAVEYILGISNQTRIKGNNIFNKNHIHTMTKPERIKGHNAVMPESIVEHLLQTFTDEGDNILDCYMGSGTTAYVCKKLNRNCIGYEINDNYVELSKQRLNEKS